MPSPSSPPARQPSHGHSYMLPVAVFLFGIVLCIAATFHVLIFLQQREGARIDAEISQIKAETDKALGNDLQKYLDAKAAAKSVAPSQTKLSTVLAQLFGRLPSSVLVSSLAIDTQNKLTINLIAPDYAGVAATLVAVASDPLFPTAFIPSASTGTLADLGTVINFPVVVELGLSGKAVPPSPRPSSPAATAPVAPTVTPVASPVPPSPTPVPVAPAPANSPTPVPSLLP